MPLIFQATAVARPAYYDRNPTVAGQGYIFNALTPTGVVVAVNYTVPAGKKAYFDSLWMYATRVSAAAPASITTQSALYTPSGGSQKELVRNEKVYAAAGEAQDRILPTVGYMGPGDNFQLTLNDGSTGGSFNFVGATKVTVYDG